MKTTWNKKYVLLLGAGVLLLAAAIAAVCLLRPAKQAPEPTATPVPTEAPTATLPVEASAEPSATPEPVITPPAAEPEDEASGSDIHVWIELPASDSDLTIVEPDNGETTEQTDDAEEAEDK